MYILGVIKHIVQKILVGGGMFVSQSKGDNPMSAFDEFIDERIMWPSSVGQLPPKVRCCIEID
jgi:hypothetical protein